LGKIMRAFLYFAFATAVGAAIPGERTAIFSAADSPRLIDLCVARPAGITGYWHPDKTELAGTEVGLEEFLALAWSARGVKEERKLDWQHYYRQVGGVMKDGRRMLFISYAWAPDIAEEWSRRHGV
jgi:hypothetical protein